jgi:quercetin dioxygenase-like cupin family protein
VAWPASDDFHKRRPVTPAALPVLRWLAQAKTDAPTFSRELVTDIASAARAMSWQQTYTSAQVGADFLQNYGWSEIVGTTGTVPSERIACGFLLLGPQTHYPRHQHEAEEIYVPLAGRAAWEKGNEGWREQAPGAVIHHPSNMPHAMRTGAHPLLALYLWRSDNLRQKAQLQKD